MWLSLNIISKMVDISGISPEDLAERLTMSTAEIESVEYLNQHFKTIYAARILGVRPHPEADKLTLVDLDTGNEKYRVVCGAPNHKEGDIVALASVGTVFNEEMTIRKTKIRGQESAGMLCSERELGLSEDHSGIMILPGDTPVGASLDTLFPDHVDVRLEIDNKSITHRPDLWSHAGFAREIGALLERPVSDPVSSSLADTFENTEKLKVKILNPDAAPRYSGLVVTGITIGQSPDWLKAAVSSIGMRPINNIVDITNYVMAELGEPMHAFDRKKLKGDTIFVRMAQKGESLMTLDGQTFSLCDEDIVIADSSGAIALAGVMGGGNSEIEDGTTEIVLEAATFNPVNIRKTAARYGHRTEAAIRFEKSLSPQLTTAALLRCFDLIRKIIPGARAASVIIDDYPKKQEAVTIGISTDHIRKRLGETIDDERILSILRSLDFAVDEAGGDLTVTVPPLRSTKDVLIPEDIVEEVGRIYRFDNIKPSAPEIPCSAPQKNPSRLFERSLKNILSTHYNMIEVSGYSFVGEDLLNRLGLNEDKELRLRNPLSSEQDRLRRSLVPNMIKAVLVNQRYSEAFSVYELGRVYLKDDRKSKDLARENTRISGVVYNRRSERPLFYEAKNIVSGLIQKLRVKNYSLQPETNNLPPYAHPGRSMAIIIDNKEAGQITEVHPAISEVMDISGRAALFDLDGDMLFTCEKLETEFIELQKFPEVPFEISVIADKQTYSSEISAIIEKSSREYIKSVRVLSVYEGAPIPEGKKSVSVKVIFASREKTLTTEEVEKLQKGVIANLTKGGYSLR